MDKKGRVTLPAPFRPGADESFVLLQWKGPGLTLFPPDTWARIEARLVEFRRANPDASDSVLQVSANATKVAPDAQHRILVPGWLKDAAGLEGPVVLIGNLDRIELRSPQQFEAATIADPEAFDRFSNQIFG